VILSGEFEDEAGPADVDAVLIEIKEALAEEQSRQERLREAEEA